MARWQITPPPSAYLAPRLLTKLVSTVLTSPISTDRQVLETLPRICDGHTCISDNDSSRYGHGEHHEKADDNGALSCQAGDEEQTTRLDPSLNPGTLPFEDGKLHLLNIESLVLSTAKALPEAWAPFWGAMLMYAVPSLIASRYRHP